jgi:hypothetical protein
MHGARERPTRFSWYFHCKQQCASNGPPPTTRAGWSFARCPSRGFVAKMRGAFSPSCRGTSQRDASAGAATAEARCDASRSMRAQAVARPHLSRRAHARSSSQKVSRVRTPQDEDEHLLRVHSSPFETAHLVPAPALLRPGFASLLHSPQRGVGGAPRDVRVLGGTPVGVHITRHARRLARRLASHDAGRSPLGAPPWRF